MHKPQIGEAIRPLEAGDIGRSNILLYITEFLMVIIVLLIRLIIMLLFRYLYFNQIGILIRGLHTDKEIVRQMRGYSYGTADTRWKYI